MADGVSEDRPHGRLGAVLSGAIVWLNNVAGFCL